MISYRLPAIVALSLSSAFTVPLEIIAALPDSDKKLAVQTPSSQAEQDFQLARAYLKGKDVPPDAEKSLALMRKAAEEGHPDALGGVGYFYAVGLFVEKDPKVAADWFRRGAEKGSPKSQLNLGLALARGSGLPKDEAEGLRWIGLAAQSGQVEALYAEGETYYYGQFGRTIDYAQALTRFQAAATKGHAEAQNTIGVIYSEGQGVPRDREKGLAWLLRSSEQGNAKAQSNLAHALGAESADAAKRQQGLKWLVLAADQNEVTAQKTLEELQHNIAPEEVEEARKWAAAFVAKPE